MEAFIPTKAFEALAHDTRLAVFQLLIPAGRDGLTAGDISTQLGLPANSLSFHLERLVNADLIGRRRDGRHLYYAVRYARLAELVDFLSGDCCAAVPAGCLPECPSAPSSAGKSRRSRASVRSTAASKSSSAVSRRK